MKVSLSWLQSYVDLLMDADTLTHRLTMAGLEVDAVYDRYDYLNSVLVGRVTQVTAHPQADKLKLCRVEAAGKTYHVVCGAPNVTEGILAPLALPGTELIDGTILTRSTIRGQQSEGMLCSEVELGLGLDSTGLMMLDTALEAGTPLNQALNLSDLVLDIGLTPNRSDCLSIIGIAREVAGLQGTAIKRPTIDLQQSQGDLNDLTSVTVEAPEHCPRYTARLITHLKVAPSPFWLQDRLRSVGLRPINNLVDITNFVMLETGQPLHAFDFETLAEQRIIVRTANTGEKFTTLDNKERVLDSEMLMICDGQKPVGIAGVMGGLNSEIEPHTTQVLLESAYFDPVSIRKTAKKLGLNTDAAHRFERGVDPQGTRYAADRATELMIQLGQGKLVGGIIDVCHNLPQPETITLNVEAANRTLGTRLKSIEMGDLLRAIEFNVHTMDDQELQVTAPSFRVDVSRPEDLMEEVARLWGYDNIPTTFPVIPAISQTADKQWIQRQLIREKLAGMGFNEAINYSFIHKDSGDRIGLEQADERRHHIEILNPLTEDQAVMRSSLIPGLLETMQRNLSRQVKTLRLFEIGKVFIAREKEQLPKETDILAGLWTGDSVRPGWYAKTRVCDFYDLKGILENLFQGLHLNQARFTRLPASKCAFLKRGAAAAISIKGLETGVIGEVNSKVLDAYNLKQSAFVYEIDLGLLTQCIPDSVFALPLPKYPSTTRDTTLIVDCDIEAQSVVAEVQAMAQPLVEDIQIFDIFEGGTIPANRKSVSLRLVYRSTAETLEDEIVNKIHKEISDRLVDTFKADLPAGAQ